jgi:hypothetical protein
MAGAANCAKIRLTARNNGLVKRMPELQTISFNGRVSEKLEQELFFSMIKWISLSKGLLTYAYHLMFSRDEIDLNQLSFGISGGLIQSQLDETSFFTIR